MLAVQFERGRIAALYSSIRLLTVLVVALAAGASAVLAASAPCIHRHRIWLSGFSLGDQCLASTLPWH